MSYTQGLATAAGLELEWPVALSRGERLWKRERRRIWSLSGRMDLLSALEGIFAHGNLDGSLFEVQFVLESSRIRVLPFDEARGFWMAWWSRVQRNDREDQRDK